MRKRTAWKARPCCCSSHRELSWAAAVQYMLTSPDHMVDGKTRGQQRKGDFYYDRRLRFRIANNILEYCSMLFPDRGWHPYVTSSADGRGRDTKTFIPVGHVCCCECQNNRAEVSAKIEELKRWVEELEGML